MRCETNSHDISADLINKVKTMSTIKELYEQAVAGGYENYELRIDCEEYVGAERGAYEPNVMEETKEVYI